MRHTKVALFFLVVLPTLALAQRGGSGMSRQRGEKSADWNSVDSKAGIKLSNRDIENISPIKLLIDKKKDLKLSDEQVNKLKDLEGKLRETNDLSFKALDSLRRAAQPPMRANDPNNPTSQGDEDRDRMMSARRGFTAVVATIRENYDASAKDALAILDETQQKTATDLLEKQKKDAEEMIRDRMGGRG